MPIWIADYVLAGYGTGAVMAVPAHDERDFAFAQIYDLPIKQVVYKDQLTKGTTTRETDIESLPLTEKGYVYNSQAFNGQSCDDTITAVIDKLTSLDRGSAKVTYKLRDWVFSRQRYWGEPIPIYFPVEMLEEGGDPRLDAPHRILFDQPIPVPDSELPLKLPAMTDYHPGDDPQGCLARAKDWRFFQKDGKWFARETNTMPQVRIVLAVCMRRVCLPCSAISITLYILTILRIHIVGGQLLVLPPVRRPQECRGPDRQRSLLLATCRLICRWTRACRITLIICKILA